MSIDQYSEQKATYSELEHFQCSVEKVGEAPVQLSLLERANLSLRTLPEQNLSPLFNLEGNKSRFQNSIFCSEYYAMNKVTKPFTPKHSAPLSELFIVLEVSMMKSALSCCICKCL
jgi:hypothetical protein